MSAGGGWMRVTDIDPAKTKSCFGDHRYITSPKPLCTRPYAPASQCYSAIFSTHGISYSEVRGFAYGYQVRPWRDYFCTQRKISDFNPLKLTSLREISIGSATWVSVLLGTRATSCHIVDLAWDLETWTTVRSLLPSETTACGLGKQMTTTCTSATFRSTSTSSMCTWFEWICGKEV